MRGLAALFVVVNHVFLRAFPGYPVDNAPFWAGWFIYGRFAVVVFIVLSGFSLALSPARHGWRLGGGSRFARRRALRILPAYYAALAFSLAVAWLVVAPPGQGAPDAKSVVVNGLLVQNLVGARTPDQSFWSIAVEAQLYVAFPLLLLMVRRWGAIVMVAGVTLVVATVGILAPHVSPLDTLVIQSPPDLAALYVVVNHVFLRAFPGYPVDHAPLWAGWFIYGRFAVVVFIVLSGFSLALSPARNGWRLGGASRFARRRALRILPAYYAALAFSLAVAWLVIPPPGQGSPDAKSVVVNGLLVQNLVGAPTPDQSFWSIAVEAQLYVAFPLLLLMVRRWGAIVMVAGVTLVVATVGILAPHVSRLDVFVIQSPPDLAALFAVGVVSAGIVGASAARRSLPWAGLALAAAAPVLAMIAWRGSVWTLDHLFWVDLALGPAVACLLAALATGRPAPLVRVLDARPLRRLGASSYSLYLTHGPIVVLVYERIVAGRVRQGVPAFVVSLALVVPLTIVFARGFASVFEAPYRHRRSRELTFRRGSSEDDGRSETGPSGR